MSEQPFQGNSRSSQSSKDKQTIPKPPPPVLTYHTLQDIVTESRQYAIQRYGEDSHILNELALGYGTVVDRINEQYATPWELLDLLIRLEHRCIEWWNTNFSHETGYIDDGEENFPAQLVMLTFGLQNIQVPPPPPPPSVANPQLVAQQSAPAPAPAKTRNVRTAAKQSQPQPSQEEGQKLRTEYGKLNDAPSSNLDFPDGNLTAAEIMAFLPQWVKSWDVIERFISNGAITNTLAKMVNTFRDMPKDNIANNSLLRMMQGSIKRNPDPRYQKWNVGKHRKPPGWDPNNISTSGFRPPRVTHPNKAHGAVENRANRKQPGVPFKNLANGVKAWPMDDDALDLTRCIDYHLAHPDENWVFPDDFDSLINILGGPSAVGPENHDNAIFNRWKNGSARTEARHDNQGGNAQASQVVQDDSSALQNPSPPPMPAIQPGFSTERQVTYSSALQMPQVQPSTAQPLFPSSNVDVSATNTVVDTHLHPPSSLRDNSHVTASVPTVSRKRRRNFDEPTNETSQAGSDAPNPFQKRLRFIQVDPTAAQPPRPGGGKRKRNYSESLHQSSQSDSEASSYDPKRARIDESLIDPQLLAWDSIEWQQELLGIHNTQPPPTIPNPLELVPVAAEDSPEDPITTGFLEEFAFYDPNFDPSGYQYLNTFPLPPANDRSGSAGNIRFAHMHPELLLSTDPTHIWWIHMYRSLKVRVPEEASEWSNGTPPE